MIEVSEAQRRVIEAIPTPTPVRRRLAEAEGRFLRESIVAKFNSPPFEQSSFDGFALSEGNLDAGQTFAVTRSIQAGDAPSSSLAPGEAARVFTGAPVPQGTVAVAMQEDVNATRSHATLTRSVRAGEGIRRTGSDYCSGQTLLPEGVLITPAVAGLLASQGRVDVAVNPAPRISILSTGNELVEPGRELAPGEIYNSNGAMIAATCRREGGVITRQLICGDTLQETELAIGDAASQADITIISGGVSVGAYDFVKPALTTAGFSIDFWRINMKPGKPLLLARRKSDQKVALCLPGNPVSALVTLALFAAPAIRRWLGSDPNQCLPTEIPTRLSSEASNPSDRPHYVRGRLTRDGFRVGATQESYALRSAAGATALLRIEANTSVQAGEMVSVVLLSGL